ncbi:MAG: TPM domain-containing protein, partial [Butyrivibrio sp.]|nr:TPM domain-containing protein [Butyrivibrio sp.]
MRKIFPYIIFLALLAALCLPQRVRADGSYSPDGYRAVIEDEADLLSEAEENALLEVMMPITRYGSVAFISTDSNSRTVERFAQDRLHELFGSKSATVFVIDMDNRKVCVFSDGYIYRIVTKAYANTITDNIYTYATDGDYYKCAEKAYEQIYTLLRGGKISQPMKYISNALIALTLGLLINFIVITVKSKRAKVSDSELLNKIFTDCIIDNPWHTITHQTQVYDP